MKFLKDDAASLLPTPHESSDLNPIEEMWHDLKHFIWTTVKTHYKEELFQGIKTFWVTVTPQKCSRYVEHLKKIIPRVQGRSHEMLTDSMGGVSGVGE